MASREPAMKQARRVRKSRAMTDAGSRELPAAEVAEAAGGVALLLLGPEVDVVGSIYIDGNVRLEGSIDGEIRCTELDVGSHARVRGRIVAERVTVYGTVAEGSIYANVLILRPGCTVEAEIYHEHLQLENGSYFDGKSRQVTDPTALAPG